MTTRDLVRDVAFAITANKVRSGLTVLGIVIGIASVIAMVSIGQGARVAIQSSIEGLGSNLLTILPGVVQPGRGIVSSGRGQAQSLKEDDADALRTIPGVANISPELQRRFQITASTGNNTNATVIGVRAAYAEVRNVTIDRGSFFADAQDTGTPRIAVLGPGIAGDLFGDTDPIGKTIRAGGTTLTVVGVLQPKGGLGFANPDDTAFVPLGTMRHILTGADFISLIAVAATSKDDMPAVKDAATAILTERHRVAEPDFSIISQADILGALAQITTTFTLFLGAIAGISLVVGGIGIMNMMLTTVTERTREIGLRKAIGARSRDIRAQFLLEAVALTGIGGIIGIAIGWAASRAITAFSGIATSVALQSVVLAVGVAAAIGIIFGLYPARRAARLNPIEALRYE